MPHCMHGGNFEATKLILNLYAPELSVADGIIVGAEAIVVADTGITLHNIT